MVSAMNRKGQVTIFIIVAVLLVAVIGLVFLIYNNRVSLEAGNTQKESVEAYEDCINNYVAEASELIFDNSGFIELPELNYLIVNSEGYYRQEDVGRIPYLCYTDLNYARCIPQAPLLIEHLESEILDYVEPHVDECFDFLEGNLEENNYDVESGVSRNFDVELREGVIRTSVDKSFTQSRAGEEEVFDEFSSRLASPLYGIARVVHEIVNEESRECNSDYVEIMSRNTGIKIDKFVTGENIRIYSVEDMTSKGEWRFAIRGCKLSTPS
jgi:hypothetical protein